MKFIVNDSTDIYYNLALEEYVLQHCRDDSYVLLWVNETCIVVGKHQNIFEEINLKEAERRNIKVARRISGGGTVFHDRGNLNYSFTTDYDPATFCGYDAFLNPMIKVLNDLGIPAAKRRVCDIAIGDRKVSGSAQTIKNQRVLHHGTLLFDADLTSLHDLLKTTDGTIESKAVKSVRSQVVNMKDYVGDQAMRMEDFKNAILQMLFPNGVEEKILSEEEKAQIRENAKNKYATWEWNYGASPKFTFQKEGMFRGDPVSVSLLVEKGMIKKCDFVCSGVSAEKVKDALLGQQYRYQGCLERLRQIAGLETLTDYFF